MQEGCRDARRTGELLAEEREEHGEVDSGLARLLQHVVQLPVVGDLACSGVRYMVTFMSIDSIITFKPNAPIEA